MEPKNYTVVKIDGEYASMLDDEGNEMFIALALLPEGTDINTKLHFENFGYEII